MILIFYPLAFFLIQRYKRLCKDAHEIPHLFGIPFTVTQPSCTRNFTESFVRGSIRSAIYFARKNDISQGISPKELRHKQNVKIRIFNNLFISNLKPFYYDFLLPPH